VQWDGVVRVAPDRAAEVGGEEDRWSLWTPLGGGDGGDRLVAEQRWHAQGLLLLSWLIIE
jgi:hypothetical protein